jgi:hypothetical protein
MFPQAVYDSDCWPFTVGHGGVESGVTLSVGKSLFRCENSQVSGAGGRA